MSKKFFSCDEQLEQNECSMSPDLRAKITIPRSKKVATTVDSASGSHIHSLTCEPTGQSPSPSPLTDSTRSAGSLTADEVTTTNAAFTPTRPLISPKFFARMSESTLCECVREREETSKDLGLEAEPSSYEVINTPLPSGSVLMSRGVTAGPDSESSLDTTSKEIQLTESEVDLTQHDPDREAEADASDAGCESIIRTDATNVDSMTCVTGNEDCHWCKVKLYSDNLEHAADSIGLELNATQLSTRSPFFAKLFAGDPNEVALAVNDPWTALELVCI